MNFQRNRAFGLVLLAGALTLGASQVKAAAYKGAFNLPVETYWGGAVLSPGEYSVVVDQLPAGPMVHVRKGNRQVASLIAGSYVPEEESSHGRLTLVQINGVYVVKTFEAGLIGKSFTFLTPKAVYKRQLEAKETSRIVVDGAATH
jgi:hypothetical protein